MKSLLFFEGMITPKIITLVYWLMLLSAVVTGIMVMSGGYGGMTFGSFLMGVGAMIGGAIGARVVCELVIVLFKIHEHARTIANKP